MTTLVKAPVTAQRPPRRRTVKMPAVRPDAVSETFAALVRELAQRLRQAAEDGVTYALLTEHVRAVHEKPWLPLQGKVTFECTELAVNGSHPQFTGLAKASKTDGCLLVWETGREESPMPGVRTCMTVFARGGRLYACQKVARIVGGEQVLLVAKYGERVAGRFLLVPSLRLAAWADEEAEPVTERLAPAVEDAPAPTERTPAQPQRQTVVMPPRKPRTSRGKTGPLPKVLVKQ